MAEPSACRDWYFRPARNNFNFGNKKKITWSRSGEYGGEAKQLLFLPSKTPQPLRRYEQEKTDKFKTSGRASFLIILFKFFQYYVFLVLSCDAFALFHRHFSCDSFTREEDSIQNLLCTQRKFGNYWAFSVFRGPYLIGSLSDGLKIMDPGSITCDDIGKLIFVPFEAVFGRFNPLPRLRISQQM